MATTQAQKQAIAAQFPEVVTVFALDRFDEVTVGRLGRRDLDSKPHGWGGASDLASSQSDEWDLLDSEGAKLGTVYQEWEDCRDHTGDEDGETLRDALLRIDPKLEHIAWLRCVLDLSGGSQTSSELSMRILRVRDEDRPALRADLEGALAIALEQVAASVAAAPPEPMPALRVREVKYAIVDDALYTRATRWVDWSANDWVRQLRFEHGEVWDLDQAYAAVGQPEIPAALETLRSELLQASHRFTRGKGELHYAALAGWIDSHGEPHVRGLEAYGGPEDYS